MGCTINRKFLPLKLVYFNYVAAFTVLLPFLPIFYRSVGLSPTQSAVIYGTMPFIGFVSCMLMGALADKFRKHKIVLIVCVIMQAVASDMMVFIPLAGYKTDTYQTVTLCSIEECNISSNGVCSLSCETESNIHRVYCAVLNVSSSSLLACDSNATCVLNCETQIPQLDNFSIFCILFMLSLIGNVFSNAILALQDTITYAVLGDKGHAYGMQRLWGAVGCGTFALVCAPLLYLTESRSEIKFLPAFVLHFILSAFTAISALPYRLNSDIRCANMLSSMFRVVVGHKVAFFLGVMFVFGMNYGARDAFLFWYLVERLGASTIQFGVIILLVCIVEVPAWYFSSHVIKKIGHESVFILVFIANVIRFTGYSVIENAWLSLVFDSLHCVTFGLMLSTATHYGTIIAPRGMEATVQSLISGLTLGVGRGTGGLIAGVIYAEAGPIVMFRSYALFTLLVGVFYSMYHCIDIKCGKALPTVEVVNGDAGKTLPLGNEETVHPTGEEQQMHLVRS